MDSEVTAVDVVGSLVVVDVVDDDFSRFLLLYSLKL